MTESISRTGVLLRVEEPLPPDTPVEMVVELPAIPGEAPAHVVCSGRIVRAGTAAGDDPGPVVAATIATYRIDR
jgi:hypothetical protein